MSGGLSLIPPLRELNWMFPLFFWDQPAIILLIIIIVFSPNLQSGAKISAEVSLLC